MTISSGPGSAHWVHSSRASSRGKVSQTRWTAPTDSQLAANDGAGVTATASASSGLRWQGLASGITQLVQASSVFLVAARVAPHHYALWGLASILFNAQHLIAALGL